MDEQKLFELYEKLYFHEVEAKEKIAARLQIPLAILLSIASLYGYFLKGYSIENSNLWNIVFSILGIVSLICFGRSLIYFKQAFFGSTYSFLPAAKIAEDYRQELLTLYKDYDGTDGYLDCQTLVSHHFKNYLLTSYIDCSSYNTKINDYRSEALHKCNSFIIFNILPLAFLFIVFTLANIDKNNIEKEYKVKITNPITLDSNANPIKVKSILSSGAFEIDFSHDIKEFIMNDKVKPPPPPPPPPPANRYINEDVNIPGVTIPPPPLTPSPPKK